MKLPLWIYPTQDFKTGCKIVAVMIAMVFGLFFSIVLCVEYPIAIAVIVVLVLAYGILAPDRRLMRGYK